MYPLQVVYQNEKATFNIAHLLHVNLYVIISDDSLSFHKNMRFSTKDEDHDTNKSKSCSSVFHGAWWYADCHKSNLNGQYYMHDGDVPGHKGIHWKFWTGSEYSLAKVSMKFRPNGFQAQPGNAGEELTLVGGVAARYMLT